MTWTSRPPPRALPARIGKNYIPLNDRIARIIAHVRSGNSSASGPYHLADLNADAFQVIRVLPRELIRHLDLAEIDLICGCGIDSADCFEIAPMLETLDRWTTGIETRLRRVVHRFYSDRGNYPSINVFKVDHLIRYLIEECGVQYNTQRIDDPHTWTDPRDAHLHGLLGDRHAGTCSSLPVLIAALGRRLKMPIRLVLSPGHQFCRWDTPNERFNINFTQEGMSCPTDEEHIDWPMPWGDAIHQEQKINPVYLISLTPEQEFAGRVATRAFGLDALNRRREAFDAMDLALRTWPTHWGYQNWARHLLTKAAFPLDAFPVMPCPETAGTAAKARIMKNLSSIDPELRQLFLPS